ncbi:MFS transporter [Kineosporia sp. A_224]|uniref:MFS transporter n=1 Tax=Kineosporia sp. A_224 TaxID=1962180 RepID=UPI0018E93CC8|nr:MFS transporter [Kineosporia sp. A_224]
MTSDPSTTGAMAEGSPAADPKRWLGLVTISLAVALIIADATIVNVAIPSVIADLGISTTQAEWITSVYSLVFAALLITVGRLGDLYGRRRLLLAGTVVFVAASVLCALAPSGALLIAARVLQGIGGAMILPSTLSTLNATFRGRERGIAFAVWGSTIGGMAAVGPLLGGWLTTTFSWRWAFGINVFVGAVIVTGLLLYVRETKEDGATKGIDLPGTALSVVGLGGLVFSLIEGQRYGWWNASEAAAAELGWTASVSPIVLVAALAVIAVAAFVAVERRRQRQGRVVVLDLALFGVPSFRNGNIAAMIISLGEFGLLFLLPLYIQNILGLSATRTGVVLVALAAGSFFSAPVAPQLSNRLGPRAVVRIGLAAEILGILGIALSVGVDISVWRLVPWLFLYGLGVGFATAQLTGVILADVPVAKSGQASGTQSTARQVGSAFGVAIIGAVLVTTLTSSATDRLEAAGVPAAQTKALVTATTSSAGAAIGALRAEQGANAPAVVALEEAYVAATRQVGLVASGLVLLGLFASFSLGSGRDTAAAEDAGTAPAPGRG